MKTKFPAEKAARVAEEIREWLCPFCEPAYLEVAGSLRRGRPEGGDIEIIYVPRLEIIVPDGQLVPVLTNLVDLHLEDALLAGAFTKRPNALGRDTWGEKIKLALHTDSGIPVDFFAATKDNWWNYLVCRTGPAESNVAICQAAIARGWKWEPYSGGFMNPESRNYHAVQSEREVFEFVGLNYQEPINR